jgi:hypothetical protein
MTVPMPPVTLGLDWKDIAAVVGPAWGIAGTALGAILQRRFTSSAYVEQKTWDKKLEVYSQILSELELLRQLLEDINEGFNSGNREGYFQSDGFKRISSFSAGAIGKVKAIRRANFIVISDEFSPILSRLLNALDQADDPNRNLLPPEQYRLQLDAMNSTFDSLTAQARREVTGGKAATAHRSRPPPG